MSKRTNNGPRGLIQRERRDKTVTLRISTSLHREIDTIRQRAERHGVEWSVQEALHNALLEEINAMTRWLDNRDTKQAAQVRSGALATLPPSELQD